MAEKRLTVECANNWLLVSWSGLSRAEHDQTVETLRSISGAMYDAASKSWRVPVHQADRLIAALPDASYSYDAICQAVDAASGRIDRFMRNLRALGVHFVERDGHVLAFGDNVSPLVQHLVTERNAAAIAWLRENPEHATVSGAAASAPEYSAESWRQAELLATSLHNAAHNQYRQEMRWKKKKS